MSEASVQFASVFGLKIPFFPASFCCCCFFFSPVPLITLWSNPPPPFSHKNCRKSNFGGPATTPKGKGGISFVYSSLKGAGRGKRSHDLSLGISGLGQADGFLKRSNSSTPFLTFGTYLRRFNVRVIVIWLLLYFFGEQQPPFELTHKVQAMTTPYREKKELDNSNIIKICHARGEREKCRHISSNSDEGLIKISFSLGNSGVVVGWVFSPFQATTAHRKRRSILLLISSVLFIFDFFFFFSIFCQIMVLPTLRMLISHINRQKTPSFASFFESSCILYFGIREWDLPLRKILCNFKGKKSVTFLLFFVEIADWQ